MTSVSGKGPHLRGWQVVQPSDGLLVEVFFSLEINASRYAESQISPHYCLSHLTYMTLIANGHWLGTRMGAGDAPRCVMALCQSSVLIGMGVENKG